MGSILCSAIVNKAELVLNDEGNNRFDADDLFGWLKSGQREAAILKPDVSMADSSFVLVEGTKQSVPSAAVGPIKIHRNMGTDGSTDGAAIHYVTMEEMNAINPDWHTDTASATVEAYVLDEGYPDVFWVYPPQPSSSFGYVQGSYPITPADPAAISSAITLDDIYETVLIDYILYRAYSEDSAQSPYAANRSALHWNAFVKALGRKDLVEKVAAPRPAPEPIQ